MAFSIQMRLPEFGSTKGAVVHCSRTMAETTKAFSHTSSVEEEKEHGCEKGRPMQQITGSKKYPDGIRVFWSDAEHEVGDFFSFDDLVEQKINALDLLNNPRLYRVNTTSHKIESSVAGCSPDTDTCGGDLVISRFFYAPRELVWRAWTDPAFIMRWWGPKNFTSPSCRNDLVMGGTYLYCMRSPEGKEIWSGGVYREIDKPRKIVCTAGFTDE